MGYLMPKSNSFINFLIIFKMISAFKVPLKSSFINRTFLFGYDNVCLQSFKYSDQIQITLN